MNKALRLTAWVVVIHLLVTLAHGAAHTELAIELSFWMNIYVYVVILAGPLVALGLIWRGIGRPGYALLFLTMAGSFLFGAYHHFADVALQTASAEAGSRALDAHAARVERLGGPRHGGRSQGAHAQGQDQGRAHQRHRLLRRRGRGGHRQGRRGVCGNRDGMLVLSFQRLRSRGAAGRAT